MMKILSMVPFMKNRMNGQKGMSRIFLVFVLLMCCGCAASKMSMAEYSSFSLFTVCPSGRIHLALSVNEDGVLRCECEGNSTEIAGLVVRLFAMEDGKYWISQEGTLKLDDDVEGALYNPETGRLWVSRVRLSQFPYYGTSCFEGGVAGGYMHTERHFDSQVQMPDDVSDYPCIGCEVWVQVHDEVKTFHMYLFQRGIGLKEINSLRKLTLTSDETGYVWQLLD